ncbi:MAG: tRNA epoxyqueuosine(34) reductase QueG [Bryobacterales bacterium]|nr:tRNA epoxyqueuosine(34) reductase QueG [Bryobacterales bacterium]
MRAAFVKQVARECGFALAGIARAVPAAEAAYFHDWVDAGFAGAMGYLTDHRAGVRDDPRHLLPSARSVLCVAKLYNTPPAASADTIPAGHGWVSRYAWGEDYHEVIRRDLEQVVERLRAASPEPFEARICVDTAPLLERAYAQAAGLGWIAKNTCLINEDIGSWVFLGEVLLSLDLDSDVPPPDRCGTCTRCIDACPTQAIVPTGRVPEWALDARRCISYFTIELRGNIPDEHRGGMGNHIFGCDVCQDVCPWNRRAPVTADAAFAPTHFAPPLEELGVLPPEEFRARFRHSPVTRARYRGFLRNVAIAMGNSGEARFREPLERLASSDDPVVARHAHWALGRILEEQTA